MTGAALLGCAGRSPTQPNSAMKKTPGGSDLLRRSDKKWGRFKSALTAKGVFITTSAYSREARDYVKSINTKIILIDGTELTGLMVDYGVGVSRVGAYELKRIDSDFFEESGA